MKDILNNPDRLERSIRIYELKNNMKAKNKKESVMFSKRKNILLLLDIINSIPIDICRLCINIQRNRIILYDSKDKNDILFTTFGMTSTNYDMIDALQKIIIEYYSRIRKVK